MHVTTIQRFNYSGQESKNTQFAVHTSDITVTLKHSQGHQAYNGNVELKKVYNHATFQRFCFNGVGEKANIKGFFSNEEICQVSPLNMCEKKWYIHDLLDGINNRTKFQFTQMRI